jgi:predicted RNA-binding protein with RPS1 domain
MKNDIRQISIQDIEVGATFEGTISGVQNYGVFVKFGRVSGLCHQTKIPKAIGLEYLKEGMRVRVAVISIRPDKKLSLALIEITDATSARDLRERNSKTRRASNGAIVGSSLVYSKGIEKAIKDGVTEINKVGLQYQNNTVPSRAGYVAESDHVATFNTDAAFQRAKVKAERLDLNTDKSPDIALKNGDGKAVSEASSKVYKTAEGSADHQRGYGDQERLVPKDQLEDVKKYAAKREASERAKGKPERNKVADEYKEVGEKATDHLELDGVKSKSRTREESREIGEKARDGKVVGNDIVGDWGTRMRQGATQGAKVGAATSAAFSAVSSSYQAFKDVRSGEKEGTDALKGVAVDVAIGAVDGAIKGAAGGAATAAARVAAEKVASQTMKKVLGGSAPGAIAVAAVEVAKHSIDFARGIKTADEFLDSSKETAINGSASFIGAEIGFVIGGPIGALIGGIAGPWLVDTGRSWFGKKSENTVGLMTGLEQLLQVNSLPGHDGATIYHMEQMRKMLAALSMSDAVLFPDRVLLADQGYHASAEIVLVHRGRVFVADFKAWKGHLHIPEIRETKADVESEKIVIQSKIDAYGIQHDKPHRNPISSLKCFTYHFKRHLVGSDNRWKRVQIEPIAVFPDGEVTLCDRMKASGNFMLFSDFLRLMFDKDSWETPEWMLNGLSTIPTWDVLQDSRGNLYQGIIQTKQFTIKLDDGKVNIPFDAVLKVESGKPIKDDRPNAVLVTLHDKSLLSGTLENPEIILNRKGHTSSYAMNQLELVCPAFTFFGTAK